MKVKCIYNKYWQHSLTIGKIYEVIYIEKYKIINDNGKEWYYPRQLFKSLSEIRNEKIDKLLEE